MVLRYNEAGEVYHDELGLVGHMYCTHLEDYRACYPYARATRNADGTPIVRVKPKPKPKPNH
jgi:hypothetical protein